SSASLVYGTYNQRSLRETTALAFLFSTGDSVISDQEQVPSPAEVSDIQAIEQGAFFFEEMSAPQFDRLVLPPTPFAHEPLQESEGARWDGSLEGEGGTAAAAMLVVAGYQLANQFPGDEEKRRARQRL